MIQAWHICHETFRSVLGWQTSVNRHGAIDKLINDSAKNVISHNVKDILRAYNISDWQSEPHHQNQNQAELRYRTIKAWTNTIMNRIGAPAYCWSLLLQYVFNILNHTSITSLGGEVPLQVIYGVTPDISIILLYIFINISFMLLMTNIFNLKVKKELDIGLVLLSTVVTHSPIWSMMLKSLQLFIGVSSGPELLRIPIKGSLQSHQTSNLIFKC